MRSKPKTLRGNGATPDLLPLSLYIQAFNTTYKRELGSNVLTEEALGKHPRLVERINQWLTLVGAKLLKDGGYNHYRVAQVVLPLMTSTALSDADMDRMERLMTKVNASLG